MLCRKLGWQALSCGKSEFGSSYGVAFIEIIWLEILLYGWQCLKKPLAAMTKFESSSAVPNSWIQRSILNKFKFNIWLDLGIRYAIRFRSCPKGLARRWDHEIIWQAFLASRLRSLVIESKLENFKPKNQLIKFLNFCTHLLKCLQRLLLIIEWDETGNDILTVRLYDFKQGPKACSKLQGHTFWPGRKKKSPPQVSKHQLGLDRGT